MSLNICLFVAVSMLFFLDILLDHLLVLLALLLPVEFKVNVACNSCDGQIFPCQFHNFLQSSLLLDTIKLWIHVEVLSNDFVRDLYKTLNLIAWECSRVVLLCLENCLGDVAILELLLVLFFFGLGAGCCLRCLNFLG